jgi:murein DD-endopeptidase MepM/ murein hydrolase activator NlpD
MRALSTGIVIAATLLTSPALFADPPPRGRALVEPGAAGGAPARAEPLHAYVVDGWREAQPVPRRLRALVGPGPAFSALSVAMFGAPLPSLPPAVALAVLDRALEPEPSDTLVALAVARARARADALVDQAVTAGRPWRLEAPFATLRGALSPPVRGRVELPFGPAPVPGRFTTVRHPGVTWAVGAGAEVHAVARGIVRYAGELNGYGRVVIMDHGTGYHSVYALLSRVEAVVGALVEANECIGLTGVASPGGGARLYFELRYLGDPLDPAEWLRANR